MGSLTPLTDFNVPKIIFSDFDGTLTDGHEITSKFLEIGNFLKKKKIKFIIHTGRSLGWGHFLTTHFDFIKAAIVEGGGAVVFKGHKGLLEKDVFIPSDLLAKLDEYSFDLVKNFPNISLSADSASRLTDRAVELRELEDASLLHEVKLFMRERDIRFSTSNVHLNFWLGDMDKYSGFVNYMEKYEQNYSLDDCWFFGDSLNDGPMFQHHFQSVGVANIDRVAHKLDHLPTVILKGSQNLGPHGVFNFLSENIP